MEIKNAQAFKKWCRDNFVIDITGNAGALWNAAYDAGVADTNHKPVKWSPKDGINYVNTWGNVNNGSSCDGTRLFGMERETEEQAIKARDDYRLMHLIHTWLTEHGWSDEIVLGVNACDELCINFVNSEKLTKELFNKLKSGEIDLSPKD